MLSILCIARFRLAGLVLRFSAMSDTALIVVQRKTGIAYTMFGNFV